jgi:hypothetical protein
MPEAGKKVGEQVTRGGNDVIHDYSNDVGTIVGSELNWIVKSIPYHNTQNIRI